MIQYTNRLQWVAKTLPEADGRKTLLDIIVERYEKKQAQVAAGKIKGILKEGNDG